MPARTPSLMSEIGLSEYCQDINLINADALIAKFEALVDPQGTNIGTKVFKPKEIYKQTNGVPPDLIVCFGDLFWQRIKSIFLR